MVGLSDFELGEELGSGVSGRVIRARHRPSGLQVALKTATPRSPAHSLSLERELAALARLDHPAILHLYDQGLAGEGQVLPAGTYWMALEYAGGGTLEDWRPAAWEAIRDRLGTLLKGLAHAHARGLVHRDLKPANLLICDAHDVRPGLKIADFGLAWAIAGNERGLRRAGSPAYMPPEQIRGEIESLGPWTDLYALACVVWEWLTGAPPFGGLDAEAAMDAHLHEDLPTFLPEHPVPPGVGPLLTSMLTRDWRERPPTAAHVLRAIARLGRVRTHRPISSKPLPVPARWRGAETPPSSEILYGVGLGLFARRDPGIVGRNQERDALWTALGRVARTREAEVVALSGVEGIGRRRLIRWLTERVRELGCGDVVPGSLAGEVPSDPVVLVEPSVDEAANLLLEADCPVLVVLRVEPADDLSSLSGLPRVTRRELGPLGTRLMASFLRNHLGLSRGLADQLAGSVQGHPGLAIDRVRSWVAWEDLHPGEDGFVLAPGVDPSANFDVDDTRRALLDRVLGSLPEQGRLAVALAALLGTRVRSSEWFLLIRRYGLEPRHSPLRRLTRDRLIEPVDDGWVFSDPGVRLALIEELGRHGERADFHRSAAEVLQGLEPTWERRERLGRHRVAADGLEAGRVELEEVMYERMRRGQWVQVNALVELLAESGVAHLPVLHRFNLLYNRALASANLEGPVRCEPHLDALIAGVSDYREQDRHKALRLAIQVHALARRYDRALELLERTDAEDPVVKRVYAMMEVERGDRANGIRIFQEMYASETDPMQRAKCANGLGLAYLDSGELDLAETWFRRVLDEDLQSDHVPLVNIASVRLLRGDPASGIPLVRRAVEHVRDNTLMRRGSVALVGTIIGIAARDRALVEQLSMRAIHATTQGHSESFESLRLEIDQARATALPEHLELLDTLARRLQE